MPAMSFAEAANLYIENLKLETGGYAPKKKCYIARKKADLDCHMIPFFGHLPLDMIRRPDIERYKKCMLEKGYKPGTINVHLAILSHLFNRAIEWEWIDKKPRVVKYKLDNIRTIYLSTEEIARLIHAASLDVCPVVEPFIRTALGTAMRRYEILSIRIEHIDLNNREIFIPDAKCGSRMQPMTGTLAKYLERYLKEKTVPGQIYLFTTEESASGHREEIEKPFRRVVEAAGLDVKQVCRHTLRHTAITHLVQAGVDLPTVMRFSGHKSIQMVFRYAHQSKDHLQQSLDKLESRIPG